MAEFASKGVAGTGLGLGIAGTALGVLNGGLSMLSGTSGSCHADCGEYSSPSSSLSRLARSPC